MALKQRRILRNVSSPTRCADQVRNRGKRRMTPSKLSAVVPRRKEYQTEQRRSCDRMRQQTRCDQRMAGEDRERKILLSKLEIHRDPGETKSRGHHVHSSGRRAPQELKVDRRQSGRQQRSQAVSR